MEQIYDNIVIGAGIVGCAIAATAPSGKKILVLERNNQSGLETSRFNSGVIHSGVHLNGKFLKARLVSEGKKLVLEHCQRHPEVAIKQVGMHIVVAPGDITHLVGELKNLWRMVLRARRLRVNCRLKSRQALLKQEPEIDCVFALSIPENCIIDAVSYVRSLESDARNSGVDFRFGEKVEAIRTKAQSVIVTTSVGQYRGRVIINAAGLEADNIARLGGYDSYRQVYYRGEYYEVSPESAIKTESLIYPVHRPGKPGLGVHITPTVDGRLLLGPNAARVARNTDYSNYKTSAVEFFNDVRVFLPRLKLEHLTWAYSGIRPKLSTGKAENDFSVNFDTHPVPMVNLIGIESPGLTAALALAKYIWSNLDQQPACSS